MKTGKIIDRFTRKLRLSFRQQKIPALSRARVEENGGTMLHLEKYLEQNKIWYRFILKPETVHTADAAKVTGVDLSRLTKNLVSETDQDEYVMLIVPGDRKVDLKAAAKALNVSRVHLVPFEQSENISGYSPGGTPSIGHKAKMRTVVDKSLLKHDTVYCGGGSRDKLLELKTEDIIKLNNAIVADISIR